MTRFSKFREFHRRIFLKEFFTLNLNELLEAFSDFARENEGTPDGEMGKWYLGEWLMFLNRFDELSVMRNELEQSKDPIIRVMIYSDNVFYYHGWLHPPIDVEKAKFYYNMAKEEIENIQFEDDWEKYHTLSGFLHAEIILEKDHIKRIEMVEKLRDSNRSLPEYGDRFALYQEVAYGSYFEQKGMFEEAKISFQRVVELSMGKTDLGVFGYSGLINLSVLTGDLAKAREYSMLNLQCAIPGNNTYLIALAFDSHAYVLELSSTYQEAEEYFKKAEELYLQSKVPSLIFKQLNSIFSFYHRMYNITDEKKYLENSILYRNKMLDFAANHPEDLTMNRLANRANAMILKLGGLSDRAKAIDIFDELIEMFPTGVDKFYRKVDRTVELKLHMLEIYFQDLANDVLGTTNEKVNQLVDEIGKSPLMKNPLTITEYSSYQIIIAKYEYYVEGKIDEALKLLYELKTHASNYDLVRVVGKIDREIHILETEISKWKDIELSIQDRIRQSELNSYMREALNLVRSEATID